MAFATGGCKRLRGLPAVTAFRVQLEAGLIVWAGFVVANSLLSHPLGALAWALVQALCASFLSLHRRAEPWWHFIHLGFMPAVIAFYSINLPPIAYLAGFGLLLGVYWSSFRTRVPLYLSSAAVRRAVAQILPQDKPFCFADVGSGLGGLVLNLSKQFPQGVFTGIEIAPLPWLVSALRRLFRGATYNSCNSCTFKRGDYDQLDLDTFDVVFAFLSPAAMPALWQKASAEMRPGSVLLSCEFPIAGVPPAFVLNSEGAGRPIYGWVMPAMQGAAARTHGQFQDWATSVDNEVVGA